MNIKAISLNIGKALQINALFMFIALVVSVLDGFDAAFTPLLISFIITMITGSFPFIFARSAPDLTLSDGYLTIVLSWLLSFIVGMLPYVLYGGEFTLMNAWFESVSGYTTTGATILTDIEALPKSLLFWRSSTHYIGGLGVVVFLLLILPDTAPFKHRLSNIEISSMSKSGYNYKAGKTVRVMLTVYVAMTIVETLLLWAAGMSLFDALNHSFSTIATGGFSTKNTSIMHFDSPLIDIIIMVFMALAAMHFGVIYAVFARRSLAPMKNSVTRYYFGVMILLSSVVMIDLLVQGGYTSFGKAALDSSFQVVSFLSTTGFGQADNATWPLFSNIILLFAAIHCGCSGSTTGGLKSDRMLVAFKAVGQEFKKRLHPSSVFRTRIDGVTLKDETISAVFLFIVTYIAVLLSSFIIVLATGVPVAEAFSGTLASIGNAGPGMDALGTMGNYSAQPDLAKFVYSIDMYLGRIEIFPLLVVISLIFRRNR